MVSIATSKSGVIDRMRVTPVTAITPCVGGLVIWYPDHDEVGDAAPELAPSPSDPRTTELSLRKSQQ